MRKVRNVQFYVHGARKMRKAHDFGFGRKALTVLEILL